jgi:hypothetical protein
LKNLTSLLAHAEGKKNSTWINLTNKNQLISIVFQSL